VTSRPAPFCPRPPRKSKEGENQVLADVNPGLNPGAQGQDIAYFTPILTARELTNINSDLPESITFLAGVARRRGRRAAGVALARRLRRPWPRNPSVRFCERPRSNTYNVYVG